MIARRALVLAGGSALIGRRAAALPVAPAPVSPAPIGTDATLAFRLMRHDTEIGRHTITFDRQDEQLHVHIAVDALVSILSIPVVRYRHRAEETWAGPVLIGLTGETDKNGARGWMQARHSGAGLVISGSKTHEYLAPESALPTSYWNRRMLDGPMISLEDGVLLHPKVSPGREDTIRLASGTPIPAEHYNLSGAFAVDVWYDQMQTWAGLAFSVADGSDVHYERL